MLSLCNIERLRQLTPRRQINKATPRLYDSKTDFSTNDWQDCASGNSGFQKHYFLGGRSDRMHGAGQSKWSGW
jgi:hypothetical protein